MKIVSDGVGDAVLECRPMGDNAGMVVGGLEVEGSVGVDRGARTLGNRCRWPQRRTRTTGCCRLHYDMRSRAAGGRDSSTQTAHSIASRRRCDCEPQQVERPPRVLPIAYILCRQVG
jgi:hypothetical protein